MRVYKRSFTPRNCRAYEESQSKRGAVVAFAHRFIRCWLRVFAAMAVGAIALTVTSVSGASASTSVPLSNSFGYKYGYAAAVAELPKLYAGTNTAVNTTSRPGREEQVGLDHQCRDRPLSRARSPSDAATAAAQAIGWKVDDSRRQARALHVRRAGRSSHRGRGERDHSRRHRLRPGEGAARAGQGQAHRSGADLRL